MFSVKYLLNLNTETEHIQSVDVKSDFLHGVIL